MSEVTNIIPKLYLTSNGWKMFHECYCSGIHRQEFKHDNFKGYEVVLYYHGKTNNFNFFRIRLFSRRQQDGKIEAFTSAIENIRSHD